MINEVCNNIVVVQTSLMKRPSMSDLITAIVTYFMQIRHFSILLSSMTINFEVFVVTFIVAMFLGWEVNWEKRLHAVSV